MKFYVLRKRGQVNTSPLQRSERSERSEFLGAESMYTLISIRITVFVSGTEKQHSVSPETLGFCTTFFFFNESLS